MKLAASAASMVPPQWYGLILPQSTRARFSAYVKAAGIGSESPYQPST
jgi:hypothetical protein